MIAHALLIGAGRLELRRPAGWALGGSGLMALPLAVMLMLGGIGAGLVPLGAGLVPLLVAIAALRGAARRIRGLMLGARTLRAFAPS